MAKREIIIELRVDQKTAVNDLGKAKVELINLKEAERALVKEIKLAGSATALQQKELGRLQGASAKTSANIRELRNEVGELTKNGQRFRDKMAEASRAGLGAFGLQALSVTAAVTGAVAVFRDAIGTVKDFEVALSGIKALGGEYAENIDAIAEATKTAGIAFGFTAVESANGVEALAKAGVSAADILGGGLEGALTLAAAGELSVADAAEIASKAMVQFGLSGGEVTKIADLLANGANKATGDVSDFGQALNQSGQVASQFGISIEDTIGTLTAFANAGLVGSDAGTSFRTMLLRLAKPSKEATEVLDKYNISAFDLQGNFVGIDKLAGQLQTQLKDLTEEQRNSALATVFGTDAIRSASILYKEGADGIAKWTEEVSETGTAAAIAAERTNNLSGDVDKLKATYDSLILSKGGIVGFFRDITQGVTGLLDAFNDTGFAAEELERITGRGYWIDGLINPLDQSGLSELTVKLRDVRAELAKGPSQQKYADAISSLYRQIQNIQKGIEDGSLDFSDEAAEDSILILRDQIKKLSEDRNKYAESLAKQSAQEFEAARKSATATKEETASIEESTDATKKKSGAIKGQSKDLADLIALRKELAAEEFKASQANLTPQQQEVNQAVATRDNRIDRAKGDTKILEDIEIAYQREILAIRQKYGALQTAQIDNLSGDQLKAKLDALKVEAEALAKAQVDTLLAADSKSDRSALIAAQGAERLALLKQIQDAEALLLAQAHDKQYLEAQLNGEDLIELKKRQDAEVIAQEKAFQQQRVAAAGTADLTIVALEQTQRINNINGVRDYNNERALITARFYAGEIRSAEQYWAEINAINKEQTNNELGQKVNALNSFQALADAAANVNIAKKEDEIRTLQDRLETATTDQEREEIQSQIARAERSKKSYEKQKKDMQVFAIAAALISTYQSAALALSSPPGPPYSLIYVAGAIAAGLAQVAKIASFSTGGVVQKSDGPAYSGNKGDTMLISAYPGETVVNPKQRRRMNALAGFDVFRAGGVPGYFSTSTGIPGFAVGGTVPAPSPQSLVQVEQVALAAVRDPNIFVRVTDINKVQGTLAKVIERNQL